MARRRSWILVGSPRRVEGLRCDRHLSDPGATETDFFERADMLEAKVRQSKKDDPVDVARVGSDAMMRGDDDGVSGWKNTLQSAIANVTPAGALAEQHRRMAEPGSAQKAGSQAARMRVP